MNLPARCRANRTWPAVVVREPPIGLWIVAVAGKEHNAAGIVLGFADSVLHLAGEKFRRAAAKCDFEGTTFQVALGLHFAVQPEIKIGAPAVVWMKGRVGVHRAKQVNTARPDIGSAERALVRCFRPRQDLLLENLALRQQLTVLKRRHPKPKLSPLDKLFWVSARRFWSAWRQSLIMVTPETWFVGIVLVLACTGA